jgi:hypothetical protein
VEAGGNRPAEAAQQQFGSPPDSTMHTRRIAGAAGGASVAAAASRDMEVVQGGQQQQLEFTPGCMAPPAPHHGAQHHHSQQRSHIRSGAHTALGPTAPCVRDTCQSTGSVGQQQQHSRCQQQQVARSMESLMKSSTADSSSMDMSMDSEQWKQQQQQHATPFMLPGPDSGGTRIPGMLQASCHLPPCPSPGGVGRLDQGFSRKKVERAQGVNAMMQVTVTETLGFR